MITKGASVMNLTKEQKLLSSVHLDQKILIPDQDLKLMRENGFVDCSYSNDLVPSFSKENSKGETFVIYYGGVYENEDITTDQHIVYTITANAQLHNDTNDGVEVLTKGGDVFFPNVESAIKALGLINEEQA